MSIDLSSYASIGTALLVSITVDEYKATPSATPSSTVLRFTDYYKNIVYGGNTYTALGRLVGVTTTTSELKTSTSEITITISGIPNTSIAEIINSRIKGCPVNVYRYVFNSATEQMLAISGNPAGRFFGVVNNYSLDEDYDNATKTATNTITLVCSSITEILGNKTAGRKTNPNSHKTFYPSDVSMDRVPNLKGTNFDFGVPR